MTMTLDLTPRTARAPVAQRSRHPTGILLVEDEPLVAEVFQHALQRAGHAVVIARDGLQAWRQLHERPVGAVLLDLNLPGLPGAELVRRIRAEGHLRLPILVLSGSDRRQVRLDDELLRPGCWLPKPQKPRDVLRELDRLLAAGTAQDF